MNRKFGFGINHISRLEAGVTQWDRDRMNEKEALERANFSSNISNFIDVINNVNKIATVDNNHVSHYRKKS